VIHVLHFIEGLAQDLLAQDRSGGLADGAAFALETHVFDPLAIADLQVRGDDVAAARVAALHRHRCVGHRPAMPGMLVMIQDVVDKSLPVKHGSSHHLAPANSLEATRPVYRFCRTSPPDPLASWRGGTSGEYRPVTAPRSAKRRGVGGEVNPSGLSALNRCADQVAPLRPGAVVVAHVRVAEQIV